MQFADCICSKMWVSHMYSVNYHPRGQLSSYYYVHSIVLAGDPGIALPIMAQLQVAQEEEHRKHFTDFCTWKYYGDGGASCMRIIKHFTEMGGVMHCAVIWRSYSHNKLCVYSHR